MTPASATETTVPLSPAAAPTARNGGTYVEILRSTALIGGSSVLSVLIGVVNTKTMAVLLGPAGFGLMGVYSSIADLSRSVACMGINNSGVRQIAESAATGDTQRIARTIQVLRRTAVLLGLVGAALMVLLSRPISTLTFGNEAHAGAIALLSLAVWLRLVADGQGALVQGLRRVSDLARIAILGALFGMLAAVAIVYHWRADGVVPALLAVAAASALTSWWYGSKVQVEPCMMTGPQLRREAAALLNLGLAFMASGLLMTAASYVVRLLVLQHGGLAAAGYYQAAWTVGGLYVGFVLQAMGADFYPRLVGAIGDPTEANRLVNEQAVVSTLLAGPGVLATITLAPLVVPALYSGEFSQAVEVLRWTALGMAMRVVTWPMGFVIVARNHRSLFFGVELAWTVVNIGLSALLIREFGVNGAGMAFFGSYLFHGLMLYPIVRRLTGFRWSHTNLRLLGLYGGSIALVFSATQALPTAAAVAAGSIVTLASTAFCARRLFELVPDVALPRRLQGLACFMRRH